MFSVAVLIFLLSFQWYLWTAKGEGNSAETGREGGISCGDQGNLQFLATGSGCQDKETEKGEVCSVITIVCSVRCRSHIYFNLNVHR